MTFQPMKYSLCIEPVFPELDFCNRIAAAKACGVDAIEFWDITSKDIKQIARVCAQQSMPVAAVSVYDSWGVRLNQPRSLVLAALQKTLEVGQELGCKTFIGLAGDVETYDDSQKSILIENLKAAAELLEPHGACLTIEALNSRVDHKGYYLNSSYHAFEITKCVDSPAIKVLYDCYHMQIMEGNIVENVKNNVDQIGHFHSAGVPGRHEPFSGELYYPFLIQTLEKTNYSGYFGMEFWPASDSQQSVRDTLAYFKGKRA